MNLNDVVALFLAANIDGIAFVAMTNERLQELGVSDPELRQFIITNRDNLLEKQRRVEQIALIKKLVSDEEGVDYTLLVSQLDPDFIDALVALE
jgi:hypothetical protein